MKSHHCIRTWQFLVLSLLVIICVLAVDRQQASAENRILAEQPVRVERNVAGWKVLIHPDLLANNKDKTDIALELLEKQLEEILRVVPATAVEELQKVPLYFSPQYSNTTPRAEYHPGKRWLIDNGRDPAMAKGVEFSNIDIFERETRRMPNFALHELAHAYHDRVLADGHNNAEIKSAFEKAKASGLYNRVERKDANGRSTFEKAYAMVSPAEYFAETSEAFFSTNDFFPFIKQELKRHDPEMNALLAKLWGTN